LASMLTTQAQSSQLLCPAPTVIAFLQNTMGLD
jgi:hypothetical protein